MTYKLLIRAIFMIALINPTITKAQCNDFITVDGKKLKCGGNDFFAVVANYWVEFSRGPITNTSLFTYPNFFPSRSHTYFPSNTRCCPVISTNAKADSAIRRDLREIKAMGFNAIRVYGCGYQDTIVTTNWDGSVYVKIPFTDPNHTQLSLDIAGSVLQSAKAAGLRVIWLAGDNELGQDATSWDLAFHAGYTNYLKEFGRRFGNDPTLLAVDFFNEPVPTASAYWTKTKACQKTKEWNDALKQYSNALSTIGLWEVGSAFWWDPNLLNVDFVSLHNYPLTKINNQITSLTDAINRIKSDYWWYKNNVALPWMIGETGMSAHLLNPNTLDTINDNGPYAGTLQDQKTFLHETLNAARDCGATGYCWWEYSDGDVGGYTGSHNGAFFGLVYASDPASPIVRKPAAQEISNFNPSTIGTPSQPPNYYSYFGNTTGTLLYGAVLDNSSNPIKDAIIELIDSVPGQKRRYQTTYSDANGLYTIYAGPYIFKMSASATESNTEYRIGANYFTTYPTLRTFYLNKLGRPSTTSLAYANNSVSSINVNSYANSYATFTNYQISSSNFKTTAGSYINLQAGFAATSNTNFNAHIGPYYHDCGSFAFRKNNSEQASSEVTFKEHSEDIPLHHELNSIFPNPGTGNYQLSMAKEGDYQVEVYNMQGAKVRSERFTGTNYNVDLQNEANGIYLFTIKNKTELLERVKIVKE
jgi:hypothetical protein